MYSEQHTIVSVSLFERLETAHRGICVSDEDVFCEVSQGGRWSNIQHTFSLEFLVSLCIRSEVNFSLSCRHGNPIPASPEPEGTWWHFWTPFFLGSIIKLQKTNTWCLHSTFLLKSFADIIILFILTGCLGFADRGATCRCLRSVN